MQPTGDLPTKLCKTCQQVKSVAAFYFRRNNYNYQCKKCHADKTRTWQENNREHSRRIKHKSKLKKYNLTVEAYKSMLDTQEGLCAICGRPETKANQYGGPVKLATDHNHKTGEVRGLLCDRCNKGLGYFKDDPTIIASAIKYLEKGMLL